jgi:hypothetical protein
VQTEARLIPGCAVGNNLLGGPVNQRPGLVFYADDQAFVLGLAERGYAYQLLIVT